MGGGGGGAQTIIENPLPDYAQRYVVEYLRRGNELSTTTYYQYTGSVYAVRNNNETGGITNLAARASLHHTIITKSEALLQSVLDGSRMNTNPKMDEAYAKRKDYLIQEFKEQTLMTIRRQANMMGRVGSYAQATAQYRAAEALLRQLCDLAEDIYGQDIYEERDLQLAAAALALHYGVEDAKDAEFLRQAGLYEREYYQGLYTAEYKKWLDNEISTVKRIEILGNAIRATVGAQIISTSPLFLPSSFQQIAGVAVAGLSLYGKFMQSTRPSVSPFSGSWSLGSKAGMAPSGNRWGARLDPGYGNPEGPMGQVSGGRPEMETPGQSLESPEGMGPGDMSMLEPGMFGTGEGMENMMSFAGD